MIRVDEITNLFEGIYAAGRWPVGIYPDWLRASLTFLESLNVPYEGFLPALVARSGGAARR